MYGLVNKAIEELVVATAGEEAWSRIRARAGLEVPVFVRMEAYPDSITYDLVAAASAELGMTPEAVLEAFGEHWILYTAKEGYGELLALGGSSFRDFLLNLHDLHTRVGLSFPHLRPPSFACEEIDASTLRLHYDSTREGLAPMVVGLLRGLGRMFHTEVTVEQVARRAEAGRDEFLVRYQQGA